MYQLFMPRCNFSCVKTDNSNYLSCVNGADYTYTIIEIERKNTKFVGLFIEL